MALVPIHRALLGRDRELAWLEELLERAPEEGSALVVRGEPGVGKSALLTETATCARERGMTVLSATGVQSEALLPFTGLHQLLRPVLHGADEPPADQRDVVRAAFGRSDVAGPELYRTALAVLDLLADLALRAPVLVVAEDAHWLDRATADVLAFVARRVEADAIVVLVATRDGFPSPLLEAGLPELALTGLGDADADVLLRLHGGELPERMRTQLLEAAAGNPLALVELPLAANRLGEVTLPPSWLPLTDRLEQAFAARAAELSAAARRLLLVAALDDGDAIAEVLDAAALSGATGAGIDALSEAVSAQLVEVDDTSVRFRHPLVRSAIRQAAGLAERQAAHAALAEVLASEPDRRTWHRAAASVGGDEALAAELEAAAERAHRLGAIATAAAAFERAAALSEDPAGRGDRLLQAAELALELGRQDVARRLLGEVEPLELAPHDRPWLAWLRETFETGLWSGAERIEAFVEIAEQLRAAGRPERAIDALLAVALRCWWSNPTPATREHVVAAAERIAVDPDDPRLVAILAFAGPEQRGAALAERLARRPVDEVDPEALRLLGTAASAVGAFVPAARFLDAAVTGLRSQGRLGSLAQALVGQAWASVFLGTWDLGAAAAAEAERLSRETALPLWTAAAQAAGATLAALRGEDEAAETLASAAERVLLPMGAGPMLALVQLARGAAALGAGRGDDAYAQLRRIFDPEDIAYHPFVRTWVVADLADAAVHGGDREEARRLVAELEALAPRTGSPLLDAALRYARPLLVDEPDPERVFQDGLSADLGAWPFLRARLLMAYGAWLRRQHRAAESRAPLRAAREAFDAIGAGPASERAAQELRASGERVRRRTPEARDELTPQELQIAAMAAAGLSNREIGQKLYLSHRTVGSHLYRIFPKLGISSRGELPGALAA